MKQLILLLLISFTISTDLGKVEEKVIDMS